MPFNPVAGKKNNIPYRQVKPLETRPTMKTLSPLVNRLWRFPPSVTAQDHAHKGCVFVQVNPDFLISRDMRRGYSHISANLLTRWDCFDCFSLSVKHQPSHSARTPPPTPTTSILTLQGDVSFQPRGTSSSGLSSMSHRNRTLAFINPGNLTEWGLTLTNRHTGKDQRPNNLINGSQIECRMNQTHVLHRLDSHARFSCSKQ